MRKVGKTSGSVQQQSVEHEESVKSDSVVGQRTGRERKQEPKGEENTRASGSCSSCLI